MDKATVETRSVSALIEQSFRDDLRNFIYTRVNRREPRKCSPDYARYCDYSTLLMKRIAAILDLKAGGMLEGLDAVRTVLAAMAMELAYWRGLRDGMRMAGGKGVAVQEETRDGNVLSRKGAGFAAQKGGEGAEKARRRASGKVPVDRAEYNGHKKERGTDFEPPVLRSST